MEHKEEVNASRVYQQFGFHDNPDDVLNIYLTGSRVYGTAEPDSDWDFLLVVKDVYTGPKLRDDDKFLNATIFPVTKFKEMIADHHFLALYCIFLPNEFKWKETITTQQFLDDWEYDEAKLKRRFFQKGGSSINRAKVYITKAEEENSQEFLRKGKKMLCHSLRFLHFGLQIVKDGRITDYSIANVYWEELKAMTTLKWKDYEGRFRPLYLELRNRYPDVPVAPFEFPPEVPQHYQMMYQYLHDTGCNTVRKEAFEKEVLNIIRADLPTLPTEDPTQDSHHAEVFASYFPNYVEMYTALKRDFVDMCEVMQAAYDDVVAKEFGGEVKNEDKKAFAARVKPIWCAPILFAMQKDGLTAREYFKKVATSENLLHWIAKTKEHKA